MATREGSQLVDEGDASAGLQETEEVASEAMVAPEGNAEASIDARVANVGDGDDAHAGDGRALVPQVGEEPTAVETEVH